MKREKIIRENIKIAKFDVIALQATHGKWSNFYDEILENILNNSNYKELGRVQNVSPKGSLRYNYVPEGCSTSLSNNYSFSEECEDSLKPIRFFIKKKL